MGVSTDGQICFGVCFEDGYEFPWDENSDGDIDEWWLEVSGFKPTVQIYDSSGNYINGVEPSKEDEDQYYAEKDAFINSNPKLPVEPVNVCSRDYPMYILAVPSTVKSASRGYPKEFNPESLTVTDDEVKALLSFIEQHGLEPEDPEPKWWLSSYYG